MAKGLGRGGGFSWPRYLSARLPEEVDPGDVFTLRALDANHMRRHPGPPDAPVCGPHQSDSDPNLVVYAHPGVGLRPLFCEAERSKNKMYLEACLQKRRHFSPFEASVDGLLGV